MIDEIVDLINDGFDGIHAEEMILGIAQRVYRLTGETVEYMPGIVNMDGEAIYAGIDDIQSIIIYHKINSSTLSLNPRSGYGDSRLSEDSILCSVIGIWDTRKVPLHSADMLLLLRSRMPQQIGGIKEINQVNILPTAALLNTKQIFESEYSVADSYLLPIYMKFMQLEYRIQIKYDQACISKCINC